MLSLAYSAAMLGIEGYVVRVEADSAAGTPAFSIIGLPDRALGEARERVRAAILNSGFAYPAGRLLVNLSPADVRKAGPAFDLAIALALMGIDEQLDAAALQEFIALGELALDGRLQPVSGILPMVLGARNAGFSKLIVPLRNADEAALVSGIELYAIDSLRSAVAVVMGHGAKWRRRTAAAILEPNDEAVHGDLGRRARTTGRKTRARDRGRGRSQSLARRSAGLREDDAGATPALHSSADVVGRGARGHEDLQRRRTAARPAGHRARAPLSVSASHDQSNRARRRWRARQTRRDLARAPRRALSRRAT